MTLSRSQASNQDEERSIGKPTCLCMVFLRYLTSHHPKKTASGPRLGQRFMSKG